MTTDTSTSKWLFQRMGGADQVVLNQGGNLCNLSELDPKLWAALSCPTTGLEFDARTLNLIDTDRDGRIRIPEVVAAVEWACARLKDPSVLINPGEALPLAAIDDATDVGKKLAATGRAILDALGKKDADSLAEEDVRRAVEHATDMIFNGDGILPPLPALDDDVRRYIGDALAVVGGVEDSGGETGVDRAISDAFVKTLTDWETWRQNVAGAANPAGHDTPEAWDLLHELRDKIDDYFLRCEMAAYAPQTGPALNAEDKLGAPAENGLLDPHVLAGLPLSRVEAGRTLDLVTGVNPAWRARLARFAELMKPFLATPGTLTPDDWRNIRDAFAPFAKALESKPVPVAVPVDTPPTSAPDSLGGERIRAILSSGIVDKFNALAAKDSDMPAAGADISAAERLVLYHRHLYRLLVNFVSFEEFYAGHSRAAFQSGTLFIDGRGCRLCMTADEVDKHSALAAKSQLFLLYCRCTRGKRAGDADQNKTINIVAAVTAGNADLLTENRNGVYVDNVGNDWDATVVKVVSNPIGLREAMWTPYKKVGNLISEQINKFASDKQAGIIASAGKKLDDFGATVVSPPAAPAAAPAFDIGRNVGIFAAVGLALGAIGTALAGIARAIFAMEWWQLPLLILGLFVIISGPSVLLAWLKLRQRTIGPLLEASGWAVNGSVVIDYGLATKLTATAKLPPNAERTTFIDPLVKLRRRRKTAFLVAFLVGAAAVAGWFWYSAHRKAAGPAPQTPPAATATAEPETGTKQE